MDPALIRIRNNIPQAFFNKADGVTIVSFHPKHAQWVKDRVKLLAMVTNQHLALSDSHALLNANGGHTRY
jgi:hypothetical protein